MTSRRVFAIGIVALMLRATIPVHADAPTIAEISPHRGPVGGGTVVTITGTSLTGTTSVTFGGTPGTALTVLNDTMLRVTTPAHAAGPVDVVVVNADGSDTRAEGFSYGNVPTSLDDAFVAPFNAPLQVFPPGVLSNDNTNEGGDMVPTLVTDVSSGTLQLSEDGGFIYTPLAGFTGDVQFTYRATNAAGAGTLATVTITVGTPSGPQPPLNLHAEAINGNNLTLRWTPPPFGDTPTGYMVEGGPSPGSVLGVLLTGSASSSFTFTAPTGAFYLRVRSLSASGLSAPSNEILVYVNVPVPPSAPENLLGLVAGSSLGLSWRNTFAGGQPTGVIVDVTGSITTSIPLPLTDTFSFPGVPAGTYTFSVRTVNEAGSSPASPPVTLTFPGACSGAPLPPTNLVVTKSGNTINVSWDLPANGPAPTGYLLNVSGSIAGTFTTTARQMAGTVGAGTYAFTVIGFNACGASAPTPERSVTIP